MGKTIEVRLSDAQYAYLWAEAEAAGQPFFGYCRAKLVAATVASPAQPKLPAVQPMFTASELIPERVVDIKPGLVARTAPLATPAADDRIARLEDAIARLTDHVLGQAEPTAQQQEQYAPPDVDSIVDAQFAAAEAEGLTEVQPDQADIEMQHAGVRPLSRRPMPFSASNTPRHLQQLLG
jgi:hypothetical protein